MSPNTRTAIPYFCCPPRFTPLSDSRRIFIQARFLSIVSIPQYSIPQTFRFKWATKLYRSTEKQPRTGSPTSRSSAGLETRRPHSGRRPVQSRTAISQPLHAHTKSQTRPRLSSNRVAEPQPPTPSPGLRAERPTFKRNRRLIPQWASQLRGSPWQAEPRPASHGRAGSNAGKARRL